MYTRVLNFVRKQVMPCIKKMSTPAFDLEVNRIVWIDMEMTGLDVVNDRIMEVACLVTDSNLSIVAEAPPIVIQQPSTVLDNMHEWCKKQHGQSGLTEECRNSKCTLQNAEETLLNFLRSHVTEKASPLAGNSVYMDRMFLRLYMPTVNDYLHYRIIDVSSIKELCQRWNVSVYKQIPKKAFTHRALDDIKESISELKYYREHFLKMKPN